MCQNASPGPKCTCMVSPGTCITLEEVIAEGLEGFLWFKGVSGKPETSWFSDTLSQNSLLGSQLSLYLHPCEIHTCVKLHEMCSKHIRLTQPVATGRCVRIYISVSLNLIILQLGQLELERLCNHQGKGSDLQAACSCSAHPDAWQPGSLRIMMLNWERKGRFGRARF